MNLNQAFYKDYYNGFDPCSFPEDDQRFEVVEEFNKGLFEARNEKIIDFQPSQQQLNQLKPTKAHYGHNLESFVLETIYPGLFTGSGYTHETGNVGELKLGFFFDHTTGLPILPGHSVKGTLRSVFPRWDVLVTKEPENIKQAKASYISEKLAAHGVKVPKGNQKEWIRKFELAIFEGRNPAYTNGSDGECKQFSMKYRDIFLDAIIVRPGKKNRILGKDAITPHGDNPLKNPIPLPFIKVLPGVRWQFSFLIHPFEIEKVKVDASVKRELFESILTDIGIGAKTNVGYGQLYNPDKKDDPVVTKTSHSNPETSRTTIVEQKQSSNPENPIPLDEIGRGSEVRGSLLNNKDGKLVFKLDVIGYEKPVSIRYAASNIFDIGRTYKLKIKQIQGQGVNVKLDIDYPSPKDKID